MIDAKRASYVEQRKYINKRNIKRIKSKSVQGKKD